MPKKPRRKAKPVVATAESSAADRIAWLLNEVWSGNRSEMARAVHVTHSALAKIARGEQEPGRRLLQAVASDPRVNAAWLLSGVGDPLFDADQPSTGRDWPMQIALELLPGPVDELRDSLSDEMFPVAERNK